MTMRSRLKRASVRRAALVTLAAISIVLSGTLSAEAGEPTNQIRGHVAKMYDSLGASTSSASPARIPALRKVADQMFDWGAMSKDTLGEHWARRSAEERSEFARLFVNLFQDAYLSKIRLTEADKFQYLGDTVHEDDATVRTNVVTKNGSVIPVTYRARRDEAGHWRVYDLDVEGVSLIRNYRAQFDSIIRRTSFEQLIARMKVAEEKRTGSLGPRIGVPPAFVEVAPALLRSGREARTGIRAVLMAPDARRETDQAGLTVIVAAPNAERLASARRSASNLA